MLKLTPTWCGHLTKPGVLNLTPEFLQWKRKTKHNNNNNNNNSNNKKEQRTKQTKQTQNKTKNIWLKTQAKTKAAWDTGTRLQESHVLPENTNSRYVSLVGYNRHLRHVLHFGDVLDGYTFFVRHILDRDTTTCLTGDISQNLHMTCLSLCLQPILWKTCLYARVGCERSLKHLQ